MISSELCIVGNYRSQFTGNRDVKTYFFFSIYLGNLQNASLSIPVLSVRLLSCVCEGRCAPHLPGKQKVFAGRRIWNISGENEKAIRMCFWIRSYSHDSVCVLIIRERGASSATLLQDVVAEYRHLWVAFLWCFFSSFPSHFGQNVKSVKGQDGKPQWKCAKLPLNSYLCCASWHTCVVSGLVEEGEIP